MRIGIDARLNAYRVGGIPQYTRQLLTALSKVSPETQFVALQHRRSRGSLLVNAPNVQRSMLWTPPHHRLEQVTLPLELLPQRLDLLHCPDFIPPLRRNCPAVITIHDLAFLRFPEILDDAAARFYGQIKLAIASAEAIIAVSEATRADCVELLGLDPREITVIYEAAAPLFHQLDVRPPRRTIGGHALDADQFLLFVSTIEPRKNLPLLLQALKICRDRQPQTDYRLVLAGARGWREGPIIDLIDELRLGEAVQVIEQFNQDELLWLYNACRLYVNPSRYEGFGLPVLEAMACGAATLVANTSSLPEVAGKAALCLPVDEPEAWAEAIERLWQDDQARKVLAEAGPLRAAQFSWEQAARETFALYERVVQG